MEPKKLLPKIIISAICIALAVAAFIVMTCGTGVCVISKSIDGVIVHEYTCMEIAYGTAWGVYPSTVFDASPLIAETFLLAAGIILTLYSAFSKKTVSVIVGVIATLCLIGSGVLFFLNLELCNLGDYFCQSLVIEDILNGEMQFELGMGAVAAGILSFVAAAVSSANNVLAICCAVNGEKSR